MNYWDETFPWKDQVYEVPYMNNLPSNVGDAQGLATVHTLALAASGGVAPVITGSGEGPQIDQTPQAILATNNPYLGRLRGMGVQATIAPPQMEGGIGNTMGWHPARQQTQGWVKEGFHGQRIPNPSYTMPSGGLDLQSREGIYRANLWNSQLSNNTGKPPILLPTVKNPGFAPVPHHVVPGYGPVSNHVKSGVNHLNQLQELGADAAGFDSQMERFTNGRQRPFMI
jgi:hypothetical protein